jgi:preprotein translocase subunit SecD
MRKEVRRRWLGLLLILVLVGLSLWVDLPWHPRIAIGQFQRDLNIRLGLDLQGGVHLEYKADLSGIGSDQVTDAMAGVRDVIERRVNAFGVSEPVVQTSKVGQEYRVIIELAGVYDPEQAKQLIGETPQLDFRREVSTEEALQQFNIDNPEAITGPVFERTNLTGKHLKRATVAFDPVSNAPEVTLEFDSEGTKLFADLTKESLNKRVAIYLDGVPISAPVVQSEITNGQAVISGGFSLPEAKQLAQRLNAGALPIPIELLSQQSVGPTLGRISVEQSIAAGILGLLAVIAFMIIFYRLPGVVAAVALLCYAVFFIALIKLIPITMTLAGVAGFILSIGVALDANVLVFERFRDNLRAGKSVPYSLENGFKGAWSSIWVSNVSSFMTAVIMYALGTSIIRGFALTLALGIALSMFTAIVVTRTVLYLALLHPATHKPALLSVRDVKPTTV